MLDALTSSSDSDGPTVRFYSDIATLEDRVELLMHQLKSRQAGEPPPALELQRAHARKQHDDAANKTPSAKENGKPSPAGNVGTPLKKEDTETEKESTANTGTCYSEVGGCSYGRCSSIARGGRNRNIRGSLLGSCHSSAICSMCLLELEVGVES